MTEFLHRWLVDRRAVAAVEFALIAPLLLLVWVAIIEVSNLHLVGRKATIAAQAAADLTAQERSVNAGKLADIVAAINSLFASTTRARPSIRSFKASRVRSLPGSLFVMEVPPVLGWRAAMPGWESTPRRMHLLPNSQQV